jgi:lipopolysaccharide/colanic/teichoic acid biosynthesis glycosyltransferase
MGTQSSHPLHTNLYSEVRNFGESAAAPIVISRLRETEEKPAKTALTWAESATKRGFDLIASTIGVVALLPVLGLIAVCIKLTSSGPILFCQERIGKDQVPFKIYKFRTMYVLSEEQGPTVTRGCDDRMTNIGKFLRKFKLDELPQLFNVIQGNMSLVGPRPKLEKHERMEMICKPGITGAATLVFAREQILLSQVPEEAFEDFTINVLNAIKAQIDTDYARKSTFQSDMKLLIVTVAGSKFQKPITNLPELLKKYGDTSLGLGRSTTFLGG